MIKSIIYTPHLQSNGSHNVRLLLLGVAAESN